MFTLLAVSVAIALFVGIRSERARQAHYNWRMYKARANTMRGVQVREAARASFAVVVLFSVIYVLLHL